MSTLLYKFAKRVQEREDDYTPITIYQDVEVFFDVPYKGLCGNPLAVDIYRPFSGINKKLPVIIMLHGGGLFMGNRKMDSVLCQNFAKNGFLVYAPEYRLLTEADASEEFSDVCAGYDFVEKTLLNLNGDPSRVYVVGESAGAYLAIYTVAMHKSEKLRSLFGTVTSGLEIKKMAFFSGMFYTNRIDLIGIIYPDQIYSKRYSDKEFRQYVNPENEDIINNLPPILLTSSDADFLKKYTLSFDKALKKAGKESELFYYEGNKNLKHAFPAVYPELPESIEILNYITNLFFV